MAFYSAFARFYDLFGGVDYKARAAYFDTLIQPLANRRGLLLDLACGTGSLSLALRELGYEVIGVDQSAEMLMLAQQKAIQAGCDLLFLQQRMERLDLYGTVEACVCALDSLNHITDRWILARALTRLALFIEPGGVFVFDVNSPHKHREVLADNCFVYEVDGAVCVWQNQTRGDLTHMTLDFFEEGEDGRYERFSEQFAERAYPPETLRELLEQAGFTVVDIYGDDTLKPPAPDAQRLIFVTKRNG